MPKFFIDDPVPYEKGAPVTVTGEDAFHILRVLRMNTGERVCLTGSSGMQYECVFSGQSDGNALLQVQSACFTDCEPVIQISVFQALIKGDKMDLVIQKSVELGARHIYPVASEHCVMKLDEAGAEKKVLRWQKIASEAAKQCGRGVIPTVHPVIHFSDAVTALTQNDIRFFCYEKAEGTTPKALLRQAPFKSVGFFIGPEGGISEKEAAAFRKNGIPAVTLGKLILRTETASPAVLSMILYETQL